MSADATPRPAYVVSYADVLAARGRLAGVVHVTPVLTSRTLDGLAERTLIFKCECLQRSGSFKARGAFNAVRAGCPPAGIVTHSSGNHGAALALAAREGGVPCTVVVPAGAPAAKRAAIAAYGATIVECAPTQAAREAAAAAIVAATGAAFVHPSEDPRMIAGAGTLALELLEQAGAPLDAIVVPIGGGGMAAGVALAAAGAAPGVRVFAAEPAAADDAARSFAAGALLGHDAPGAPPTIADGLRTTLGPHTWPIVRDSLAGVITVSEADIAAAMRLVWERLKLVIEPSAAVGVAAVLSPAFRAAVPAGARVGVVLCGGNVDLGGPLPWTAGAAAVPATAGATPAGPGGATL